LFTSTFPPWHNNCLLKSFGYFVLLTDILSCKFEIYNMEYPKREKINPIFFSDLINHPEEFFPIIADGDDSEMRNLEIPDVLPILPLRNTVLFPGVVIPITIGRQKSLRLTGAAGYWGL
jgi:hypothetical protein